MEYEPVPRKLYWVERLVEHQSQLASVPDDNLHKQFDHLLLEGYYNFVGQRLGMHVQV